MKKIASITLTLTLILGLLANAQTNDELYVYRQGGVTDTLQLSEVTNIAHSRTDLQGRRHDDYVVMAVSLADGSVRQFPLAGVDSVVMQRDGERFRLVRFVGSMSSDGHSLSRGPRLTSLDGDFSSASADGVAFYWEDGDNIYIETDGGALKSDSVVIHDGQALADFYFKSGNIPADEVSVFYPGQSASAYNEVRVSNDQTQRVSGNTAHIGLSGDCGTAIASPLPTQGGAGGGSASYTFMLDHKASYLCFLPYIANDLGRTVLKQVTVRSDSAIAGVFSLSQENGIRPLRDTTHAITLHTGDFVLPRSANQFDCSAYMVIAPQNGSTRLTCEFTVYDNLLQSTGIYTKIVDLTKVEPNMVYVVNANCNNYVVDLGLPVKFLNHNYGAFAPEEYGGYYAFGELNEKATYTSSNFVTNVNAIGTEARLTGYDLPHVKLGGNFSLPTIAEWRMLVDGCNSWEWKTINGKSGCLVTGPNGNRLFLPAGGYRRTEAKELHTRGIYHSSTLFKDDGVKEWNFSVKNGARTFNLDTEYSDGESIRPVISSGVQMTDGTTVQVMTDSAQCRFNTQQATLYGTLHGYDKAKTPSALEVGFLVGSDVQVAAGEGTMVTATVTVDGCYSAVFTMPKDTAYSYRAYVRERNGGISLANTLQFGRAYADLGLPSGNLWSSINLGCTKPEDKGAYYAWGETATKATYTEANHRWYDGHIYNFPDGLRDIQATPYDVAAVEWGGTWVTPNMADLQELVSNCTVTEETVNGMPGYRFTSTVDGYTDRSIFVPKSGWWSKALKDYRDLSYFTTSELTDAKSCKAYGFENGALYATWDRYNALAVRPVNKSNVSLESDRRMYIRTLPAGKHYNGTDAETDTLKAIIRGYTADDGTTVGIVWWPQGDDRATGTMVPLEPDDNGYVRTVITGLTPGTSYYYAGYVNKGTTTAYGETLHTDAVGLVDLGLSVKWANMNIGAVNAEDGGLFYAWGATETFNNTTQQYTANTNITPFSGHDMAVNNWGAGFRMATKEEWEELTNTDNCDWTWDSSRAGFVVTSKKEGYTSNSIFIPAPGIFNWQTSYHRNLGTEAYYWASTVQDNSNCWRMWFNTAGGERTVNSNDKNQGFSTRAVQSYDDEIYTIGMKRNVRDVAEFDTLVSELRLASGSTVESGFILGDVSDLTAATLDAQILRLQTVVNGVNKYVVTGLIPGHTYYYRAYIKDGGDAYTYGEVKKLELLQAIDLGLPSGTLWTNINTGAGCVEDFGDYYAWGETTTKNIYTESTYEFYQNKSYVEIGNDIGGSQYDAATVNMGPRWSMPTQAQCAELIANTTHERVTYNGVACWKLTSTVEGYTDRYVIFPRNSQMKDGTLNNSNAGNGVYPTSTRRSSSQAYNMYMPEDAPSATTGSNYDEKYWGKNIRAVMQKTATVSEGVYAHVGTDGCDWTIGASTATLRGHAALSAAVEGATHGFVVGTIVDVDTTTPADDKVVTVVGTNSEFSYDYTYTGGARYYRAFLKVGSQYYFGEVKAVTAADMLDVEFKADGSAFNGTFSYAPSTTIAKVGSSTCPYNEGFKRYEADLSGNSAASTASNYYRYNYSSTSPFGNKLAETHSIEVLVKPSVITSGEADVIANYESGGEGVEIMNNKFNYCAYLGGKYVHYYAEMTLTAGQYYHIVAVWDRENAQVRIYVDGVLTSTYTDVPTSMGKSELTSFIIGGQANSNTVNEAWKGSIVFARFYSGSLTDTQVQTLYEGLTK